MAEREPVCAVVVERNKAGEVTMRAVRRGEPLNVGVSLYRRAYPDNFIYESQERAVSVALDEVTDGGLRGAVAWSSGIGDWLVNGWR